MSGAAKAAKNIVKGAGDIVGDVAGGAVDIVQGAGHAVGGIVSAGAELLGVGGKSSGAGAPAGGVGPGGSGAPGQDPDRDRGRSQNAIANRVKEFATREAKLVARARAGGAVRGENDADLLGLDIDANRPKRRSASRTLLG